MWGWLWIDGGVGASQASTPVPRASIPHLVGKEGKRVRQLEELLGCLISIGEKGPGGHQTVTLCGPPGRLARGKEVIWMVTEGFHSVVDRLPPHQ